MKWIRIALVVPFLVASVRAPAQPATDVRKLTNSVSKELPSVPANTDIRQFLAPSAPATADQSYVLCPSDVLQVKVYQEDDLETKLRINRDGTATFPLVGSVILGGKTVDQAAALIRNELAKDYLVNPQVTVTVLEYAKRRFTVLGQVQRPGSYEIPNEESVTFLQAIAMAGGYTRLANRSNVTVTRTIAGRKTALALNLNQAANDPNTPQFVILAEDIITVSERIF